MFRSVAVARIARKAFENAAEKKDTVAKIQNIIRCSQTEFDRGIQEYRDFRETHDTPDWGVIRMSSIAMAQNRIEEAEVILKEQMEEYGGAQRRQARNADVSDEQICASLERVIRKTDEDDVAYRFFDFLKKYKFCANRDVFLSLLVELTVRKHGWKAGLSRMKQQMEEEKRTKNMTMSVYYILEKAWRNSEAEEAETKLSEVGFVKPSTLKCLKLFIRLCELPRLEIADFCKRNSIIFAHEDVVFLIELAGKLKYPMPLLNLLEIDPFVHLPKSSIFPILDQLIKLAGKSGEAEHLEQMMWKVKKVREVSEEEKSILYGKLRHFYKCLNVTPPKKLYFLMNPIE
ncbi:unnamed protein product [Caenorhabditis sp. 36 PRJEB53466]|nr:unnamed protein product [Caenorhabditis sp. 36 PRJEB53466]